MVEVRTIPEIIKDVVPYYKEKGGPEAEHKIVYDSSSETLEPLYFFVLDLMNDFGLAPEKLIDNFVTSPGSGHFSEMQGKATAMQQQGGKLLGDINAVLRSVLNIIYDLKEFKIRLQYYTDLEDPKKENFAKQALKQIWLDKVDLQKGQGAIHAMSSGNLQYVTLRDAFLAVNNSKDIAKLDLNERVKRVLTPRVEEFNVWLDHSGKELRKRYEIERSYLRSQVNSLKLYSRWAKPYLKAAFALEMAENNRSAELVKTFNTIILELTLLGKSKLNVKEAALEGLLPKDFQNESFLRGLKKDYFSCVLVEFKFRGIPQRVNQQSHYAFGGKAEVTFKAYALNEDEIAKVNEALDDSDLGDVLKLIEGSTTESLDQMQEEINYFLEEQEDEEKGINRSEDSNPFLALIGHYDKKSGDKKDKKKPDKKEAVVLRKESWIEKEHLRKLVIQRSKETIFSLFDIYKKAHGMPSYT